MCIVHNVYTVRCAKWSWCWCATSANVSSKLCIEVFMKNAITQCGKCVTRCLVVQSSFIHFFKNHNTAIICGIAHSFVQIWAFWGQSYLWLFWILLPVALLGFLLRLNADVKRALFCCNVVLHCYIVVLHCCCIVVFLSCNAVALLCCIVLLCCIIALLCGFPSQSAVKCWCQPLVALISIATQSCYGSHQSFSLWSSYLWQFALELH